MGGNAPVVMCILNIATLAPLGAFAVIVDVYFCPVAIPCSDQISIAITYALA
jgi:hypothetical protein